ncbi:hypothetical protein LK09_01890 [Microbacterium mangrovi]|uniref:DUF5134 domain-containing protein n=1 Tax=Microbacterium mangrovi TaxID=1348253 RepID=A0A0B2A7F4_9MICO|nr:hypothetical protein [Microbacterium mangrovi]KHK99434.1 hypothetical protein LK09_01890 [Microbacterium mangrovi]
MGEILHLWALAPAAVGTCCMAADRRRARVPELVASAVMLLAMLDLVREEPLVVPIVWAALLLVSAMALAAVRGVQRRRADASPTVAGSVGMTVHSTIGMVVMAALVAMMGHHTASGTAPVTGMAGMHAGGGGLPALVALAVGVYAVASVVAALRAHTRLDRGQFVAMGASTALMALAVLV